MLSIPGRWLVGDVGLLWGRRQGAGESSCPVNSFTAGFVSLTHNFFSREVGGLEASTVGSLRVVCESVSLWKMLGIWY